MKTATSKELCQQFLENVYSIPDGEKINQCIQCGTCSGSCPTSDAMDHSPREVIAALRAGILDRVLESNAVWLCASCYSCTVRCPSSIPFTDVMYELKRLGVKHGLYPKDSTNAVMAHAFTESVDKHGRNHEFELIRKYYLRTNPLHIFSIIPLGMKLFSKGRMKITPHKIKGVKGLRKMMATIEENGKQ